MNEDKRHEQISAMTMKKGKMFAAGLSYRVGTEEKQTPNEIILIADYC
jgi:hypothetical protein